MHDRRRLYYWNPYGIQLGADHPLRAALAAHVGWELVCIPLELQLDGWNCGPWSHAALELFVRYFEQGASGGFEAFFNANAAVRAVNGLQPRSQA